MVRNARLAHAADVGCEASLAADLMKVRREVRKNATAICAVACAAARLWCCGMLSSQ